MFQTAHAQRTCWRDSKLVKSITNAGETPNMNNMLAIHDNMSNIANIQAAQGGISGVYIYRILKISDF